MDFKHNFEKCEFFISPTVKDFTDFYFIFQFFPNLSLRRKSAFVSRRKRFISFEKSFVSDSEKNL